MSTFEYFQIALSVVENASKLVQAILQRPEEAHLREEALERLQAIHDQWSVLPEKQAARQANLDARIPPTSSSR